MRTPSSIALQLLHRLRSGCFTLIILICGLTVLSGNLSAEDLRRQLENIAAERGFRIAGIELIGDEKSSNYRSKNLVNQINLLLANYNFILIRDAKDQIAQLTIVGLRVTPPERPSFPQYIKTEKFHSEHYVEAVLTGPNGQVLPLKFMVDTGASTLVLPQSLATTLGYAPDELKSVRVQTANGKTEGLTATLQTVRVGEAETEQVAVTFVEDHLLGGKKLLGMSFLGRFRMTFDGSNGLLQLEKNSE
jgi:aspartyl protease family protein